MTSRCAAYLLCSAAAVATSAARGGGEVFPFSVALEAPSHATDERFVSFSFDASVLRGDDPFGFFSSRSVAALLAGLAPAYFRFSGTDVDTMTFNASASCDNTARPFCLNSSQLTHLLNSTTVAGLDLVLGINGRVGKSADAPNAPWDSTNAAVELAWLDAAVASTGVRPPFAYELGNEPDLWPWVLNGSHLVNGSALAADVAVLRGMIAALPHLSATPPVTFGPDACECYNGDIVLKEFARASSAPPTLQRFTWHFYNMGNPKSVSDMVSVASADYLGTKIALAAAAAATARAPSELVIGETGECVMGGCLGPPANATAAAGGGPQRPYWSEEFIDGFLFLDKLGLAAASNVSAIMKEKIFGGNDQFVSPLGFPNAPYWVMLLHKQLVGARVLRVANSTAAGRAVRVYAHCARTWAPSAPGRLVPVYPPGALVLLAVNLDNATAATVRVSDASSGALVALSPRDEFRLSGPLPAPLPGNDTSCFFAPGSGPPMHYFPSALCLNGRLLYLGAGPLGDNTTLPMLLPATATGPLVLEPLSHALFVVPGAAAPACM
jgi:hypothetical protein